MYISKVIEQLGYKTNEVKVYLATLVLGECTLSEIAIKANIPRSSAQVAVGKLHKNGLLNFYVRKRYKYWVAEPPEKLIHILKEKEALLASMIKSIPHSSRQKINKPTIKIFVGVDEIRLVFEEIIEGKHHISAIVPIEQWVNLLGQEYIDDFNISRERNFLNMRILVTENSDLSKIVRGKNLVHIKYLPENMLIEDAIFVFNGNILIISFNKYQPTGVTIHDPATARTMDAFFEYFWSQSKD